MCGQAPTIMALTPRRNFLNFEVRLGWGWGGVVSSALPEDGMSSAYGGQPAGSGGQKAGTGGTPPGGLPAGSGAVQMGGKAVSACIVLFAKTVEYSVWK
jgi:hypothetical protein